MVKAIRWSQEQLKAFDAKKVASKPAQTPKEKLQALGRLKHREMNKTELAYSKVLEQQKQSGEILWWAFEAIKLRLADNTTITIDFFVMRSNGELECREVKGSKYIMQDDAWAKTKIAADMYPWPFYLCIPKKQSDGGGWDITEV